MEGMTKFPLKYVIAIVIIGTHQVYVRGALLQYHPYAP